MAILLTGATGMTSVHIAHLLQDAKIPFLMASRSYEKKNTPEMPGVNFDWENPSTFAAPFQYKFPVKDNGEESKITAVYLLTSTILNTENVINPFIDYAVKEHGVKRFVLVGGTTTSLTKGDPRGEIWQHLIDIGVEYCILRPTWFMDNFLQEGHYHNITIQNMDKFFTATGDGKIMLVSAKDIGAVAFHALTDKELKKNSYFIRGPEQLTNDQIAEKLTRHLGRKIEHVKLSEKERCDWFVNAGFPEGAAKALTYYEVQTMKGVESEPSDALKSLTGSEGQTFDEYLKTHK